MSTYQYSFANTDLILTADYAGRPASNPAEFEVKGYGTGEGLIQANRRAPVATTTYSAYGDQIVNMQRIRAGDLVFPVLMAAPENKYLQDWVNYFQEQADADGELMTPIQGKFVDNMGKDEAILRNGVILQMPGMVRGQTMNTVTWVITFEAMAFARNHGGDLTQLGQIL